MAGENYLVPVDAKLARDLDLEYEAVTLASVLNAVGDARKLKLVILDACRNNPLSDKMALRTGVTREATRGLGRIEPRGDVLVAYAAKAGTVALDGKGRHSPYAEALLKHMAMPGIDVFRMFGRVAEAVLDATGRQQEPWLYGRPGGETIALVGAPVKTALATSSSTGALSAEEAVRICREVEAMSSLPVLGALADQHKGTAAGHCIAARMDELRKSGPEKKVAVVVPPKGPDPAPVTECDRLAAHPNAALAGVQGVHFEAIDATRAVPACREAVARHPAEARLQTWLGRSLQKSESYEEARRWYEKAVELGHTPAMNNLGSLYQFGKGVPQDYALARNWYEKAAEKGDPLALSLLGSLYQYGRGVPQDYARARSSYEKAAEKGEPVGMRNLGLQYHYGAGVPVDYARARSWYEKAAEKGDPAAFNNLGVLHQQGQGVPQDYAKARTLYEKGAERSYARAMRNLASLYQHGRGVPQDYALARSWHERAAERGDTPAMVHLGTFYREGHGVPQDYAKAHGWYEKAAEKGDAAAMTSLGFLYARGMGVPQDYAKARGWYEKAAEKGELTALNNLGGLYGQGNGVPQDHAKARSLYEKAAEKGYPAAMRNLGWIYQNGHGVRQDYAVARSWYEKAAEKGESAAMLQLARLFARGEGVARSPQITARHLLAAARAGHTTAREHLDDDMDSWDQDTRRAVQELLAAAGDYKGRPDGQWGPASRDAAKAYYMRKN